MNGLLSFALRRAAWLISHHMHTAKGIARI
jgi:hypothetical protein